MLADEISLKKEPDEFELALLKKREELEACQSSKELNSCLKCSETIGCALRLSFVDAVYKSMNKNKGGGFEF